MVTFHKYNDVQCQIVRVGDLYVVNTRHLVYNDSDTFRVIGVIESGEFVVAIEELQPLTYRALTRFGMGRLVLNRFKHVER
jgi:hypothetical protein